MEYRTLGRTGLRVSALCLGTMTFGWTADEPTAHRILSAAVDAGINFVDTADIYPYWAPGAWAGRTEEIIGRWLKGQRREALVIATKVRGPMGPGPNDQGLSRKHIFDAVEGSLRRLGTDYIDLYQVHWPDDETPLEETLRALEDLTRQGKVRYIGASNFPAWLLCKALWISDKHGWARFNSLQPHYNLLHRAEFEREPMALQGNTDAMRRLLRAAAGRPATGSGVTSRMSGRGRSLRRCGGSHAISARRPPRSPWRGC